MCRRTNRKKTRTFRVSDITVRNGVTAQPPGRHRTGRAISAPGHAAGLFPTVWQRRFWCTLGEPLNSLPAKQPDMVKPTVPSGEGPEREAEAPVSNRTLMSLLASGEDLASQGWRYYHKPAGGDTC
uniref:Uncharacterized protein n=1 Tax=Escherichia coli TaxID=562 RepID=Q8KTV4_ECOLX|nr:unknown [Escherichia coli]